MSSSSSNLVLSGDSFSNFVNTCKSKYTEGDYTRSLKQYMRFCSITDVDNLLFGYDSKAAQKKIIDYIMHLRSREVQPVSIASYIAALIHFYSVNDVNLNRKRINMYIPEVNWKHKDRPYTREEIARLLEFCDLRDRAIVLLFASTGMRLGAVPSLSVENLLKIQNYNLYQVTVYSGSKKEYICFTTPEAAKAIDTYFQYRERCGEILTPKSPVFREQFDSTDLEQIRKNAHHVSRNTITMSLARRLHLAQIITVERLKEGEHSSSKHRRKPIMKTHGFRKLVNTTMENYKINDSIRKMLLGQSLEYGGAYFKPKSDDLLGEYLTVVDALTINEENRLRHKVEQLIIKTDKLDQLAAQVELLNARMGIVVENERESNGGKEKAKEDQLDDITEQLTANTAVMLHENQLNSCCCSCGIAYEDDINQEGKYNTWYVVDEAQRLYECPRCHSEEEEEEQS